MQTNSAPLSADPIDGLLLDNDVLGVRIWGTPKMPAISIGASDIWDRRWFADRQPLITMNEIRQLAEEDRLDEIAMNPNQTAYTLYHRYDFPCPKPGANLVFLTPFAEVATVRRNERSAVIDIEGTGKSASIRVTVFAHCRLIGVECDLKECTAEDVRVRMHRHSDTIMPGDPTCPTIGGQPSATDFDPHPDPQSFTLPGGMWGVTQRFEPDSTFPDGFTFATMAASPDASFLVQEINGEAGFGPVLHAEREGRIDHGTIKRYTPINEAKGAAATASITGSPSRFTLFATLMTSTDSTDPVHAAEIELRRAMDRGTSKLSAEEQKILASLRRMHPARAVVPGRVDLSAPDTVLPRLRHPDGFYGDVPMCSVGPTKFCFQDSSIWHADFHLNEIRAEPLLTMGRFEEVREFGYLMRSLLEQSEENATDVYGLPGAMYPLVHYPLRCRGVAHTNLTWEQDIGMNGLICKPLWLYYRYTGDVDFLAETAYPVMRSCARFCVEYASEESDGYLHLIPSVSPEHWGLTPGFERNRDSTSALTLTKYFLRAASAAAQVLGEDANEAGHWISTADRLAPYPTYEHESGTIWTDVLDAPPIEYNIPVPLSPVFWGDDAGLDSDPATLDIAFRTLHCIDVWEPHRFYLDTCIRPRLGIWRNGAPIVPESFLLSYQSIRLFPAMPPGEAGHMRDLRAEGGFRITADRDADGVVGNVTIVSELGETCRVSNPWPDRDVEVFDGETRVPAGQDHSEVIEFATHADTQYRIVPGEVRRV